MKFDLNPEEPASHAQRRYIVRLWEMLDRVPAGTYAVNEPGSLTTTEASKRITELKAKLAARGERRANRRYS